jgi:hypothetical protein
MDQQRPKPMGLGSSLLHFGIPALGIVLGFYVLMPFLESQAMTLCSRTTPRA